MTRIIAIASIAFLTVCLFVWAALAWAQPNLGKLPAANELLGPSKGTEVGTDSERLKGVPLPAQKPVPLGKSTTGTSPLPLNSPPTTGPAMLPPNPLPMPQPTGSQPQGQQLPAGEDSLSELGQNSENQGNRQEPSVRLEWVGPTTGKVRQANGYSLVVRNTCNNPIQQVLVRVRVPSGMTCSETEPKAVTAGDQLMWELGDMQAKQEKILQMKLLAVQRGDVAPQAWVTFTGLSVLHIKVREPKLTLSVRGPDKVLLGETTAFTLAVANPGDGSADRVKIHATLSPGLECPRGSKIDFDIGNLAAGETRNVSVLCATKQGGMQNCEVIAEAEGGLNAKETAPVKVLVPRLELQLAGPGLRYLGRKAVFALKVSNPGDAPATNVTISDVVPDGFKVLAASDEGRHDLSTNTVSWVLGEIKPGEAHEVKLEVQAVNPGEFKHKANAVAAHNLSAKSELTTQIDGVSALMLEMVDTDDPIEVNGETAYEVCITNTGSKVETDIKLVAIIPDKMEFKSAGGPSRFHDESKTIVFEPLEKLMPNAKAVYRINVKALDPGTVRFKIQMTSTNLTEPVIKMEATRIYSDSPDTKSSH